MDFEHALEALTLATDPLDAVDGNPSLICTAKCPESSARSDCHSRCPAACVRFCTLSMAYGRAAMRVLLCAAVAAWTPPTKRVRRPTALNVEVSQMLYEQREKSIEQRGEFEEELIGSGGTSLEACAPSKLVNELLSEGVGRCDSVLDPQQADALKTFVRDALIKAERDTSKGKIPQKHRFAEVLLKENRRDFLLPLDDEKVLNAARAIAVSPIGDAVEEILGEDAVVHECSCLISDHGSPRQVLHPDTPQHETGETPLLTCFTALQDVSEDMGPTLFLPKTQDKVSHLRFFNDVTKDELLKEHSGDSACELKRQCRIM